MADETASPEAIGRAIALALTEFTSVNNARGYAQPIAPAELEARTQAHQEMMQLLAEYEEKGYSVRYEIAGPSPGGFFVDDILIEPGREIEFYRIPNQQMEPRSPPAEKIMQLYLRSIGGVTPDLADQSYNAYRNRPREPPPLGTPRAQSPVTVVGETNGEIAGTTPGQTGIRANRQYDPRSGRYKSMPEPNGVSS